MRRRILVALLIVASTVCHGQASSSIALRDANSSLALPTMAADNGILYVAYRSFDLLRSSNQLQVLAYDLGSHKELRHVTITVPKVHGARASNGLALSRDGQTLAYVEAHEPYLVLLLSTKDLSEKRRSDSLPFSDRDHQRMFAGFDGDQICLASNYYQYGKPEVNGLRFIRLSASDLKLTSDTKMLGVTQNTSTSIVWQPVEKTTWVNPPSLAADMWVQYTEAGQKTGQVLEHRNGINAGAISPGEKKLLVFYGRWADGVVVSYDDHHISELKLECSPNFYGTSNDPEYTGAICTTSPDRESEFGGDKILTSEFLLLNTVAPAVVWQQKMNGTSLREGRSLDGGFQNGDPLIYRAGTKVVIVAPSKSPALTIYEIDAPH
jgi:hypothetical protein